jgi:hypothetical protein
MAEVHLHLLQVERAQAQAQEGHWEASPQVVDRLRADQLLAERLMRLVVQEGHLMRQVVQEGRLRRLVAQEGSQHLRRLVDQVQAGHHRQTLLVALLMQREEQHRVYQVV